MLNQIKNKIKTFNKVDDDKKIALIMPLVILFMLFLGVMAVLDKDNSKKESQQNNFVSEDNAKLEDKIPTDISVENVTSIEFSVCTDGALQPECYSGDYPAPKLVWKCSSDESDTVSEDRILSLQIDNNSDFSSPELKTGAIVTNNNFFIVEWHGLIPGQTYFWRIRGRNLIGEWSEWAAHEESFVVAPMCGQ